MKCNRSALGLIEMGGNGLYVSKIHLGLKEYSYLCFIARFVELITSKL